MENNPVQGLRKQTNGYGHSYTLDGQKIPRVTTLMNNDLPKPALVSWAAKSVAEYAANNRAAINTIWDSMTPTQMVNTLKGTPRPAQ